MVKPSSFFPVPISFQVVDRAAGDFGGGLHIRQIRQHVRDRAAERIVHAAGTAGADRHCLLLCVGSKANPADNATASTAAIFVVFFIPLILPLKCSGRSLKRRPFACHNNTPNPIRTPGT
jgi:hypothetical protein